MMYASVYDLLFNEAKKMGVDATTLYNDFRKLGHTKKSLDSLIGESYIPNNKGLLNSILSYLNIDLLKLNLMLGVVPPAYHDAYIKNIDKISSILAENTIIKTDCAAIKVEPFYSTSLGSLYNGDCIELFKLVSDDSIDCVFADPPFNLNKQYDEGVNDSISSSQYLNWCYRWLDECVRVLRPGGTLLIYNLPKWHTYLSNYLNYKLKFMDWIAINMKFSLPIQRRLYPAHYSLLYYVKNEVPYTFNNQRIPMEVCRHCGGEIKDYGGYKIKMNPQGVNVSDVWNDIYPVRHKNSKNRAYNELSVKFLERVISMCSNENDIVLDPFGGSGTTFAVCEQLNRRWIGFELGDCNVIKERLQDPANDISQLKTISTNKDVLFNHKTLNLRKLNGFWTHETIREVKVDSQIAIDDAYEEE